ncbi:MAG: cytochrome c biogenesis protein ResB [Deltaproteobacteria bacterium]|nr:cytochrome c biogenesis protein ResB [Deltaproteobacteria bacterium]
MSQEVSHGKRIYDFFSSVKLAVILLSFIAISCVFGTLIKQGGTPEDYLEFYSESTYKVISFLGLDDVFHTWWFISLLILFTLNLFFCSLRRFKRDMTSIVIQRFPPTDVLKKMKTSIFLPGKNVESVLHELGKDHKVILKTNEGAYLEKGRISKYGVHFIHGSIIIILIGSLIGLIFGFRGFLSLKRGEEADYLVLRGKSPKKSELNFIVKCKDFRIDFYPDGTPKDYVSDIEIIRDGKKVLEQKIRVNEPIKYEGLYFYQASYGKEGIFHFEVDGKETVITEKGVLKDGNLIMRVIRYESSIHNFGPGVLLGYLEGNKPGTAWFLRDVERMNTKTIGGKTIRLKDIKEDLYTVLEVTKDPGVYVVWTGFVLLLFGLFLNFFTHSKKVYVTKYENGTIVTLILQRLNNVSEVEVEKMRRRFNVE